MCACVCIQPRGRNWLEGGREGIGGKVVGCFSSPRAVPTVLTSIHDILKNEKESSVLLAAELTRVSTGFIKGPSPRLGCFSLLAFYRSRGYTTSHTTLLKGLIRRSCVRRRPEINHRPVEKCILSYLRQTIDAMQRFRTAACICLPLLDNYTFLMGCRVKLAP